MPCGGRQRGSSLARSPAPTRSCRPKAVPGFVQRALDALSHSRFLAGVVESVHLRPAILPRQTRVLPKPSGIKAECFFTLARSTRASRCCSAETIWPTLKTPDSDLASPHAKSGTYVRLSISTIKADSHTRQAVKLRMERRYDGALHKSELAVMSYTSVLQEISSLANGLEPDEATRGFLGGKVIDVCRLVAILQRSITCRH